MATVKLICIVLKKFFNKVTTKRSNSLHFLQYVANLSHIMTSTYDDTLPGLILKRMPSKS